MTAISAVFRGFVQRTVRDRQIIVRSDSGVVARTVTRRQQLVAAGTAFGLVVWVIASGVALVAAGNGLTGRAERIAELEQERTRLAAEVRAQQTLLADVTQRDRDAAAVLAGLHQELGVLERGREQDQAALAALASEREALLEDLSAQASALADTLAERDRLGVRVDAQGDRIDQLTGEQERLATELAESRQALRHARSWNASITAGFARLGSTLYETTRMVLAGDAPSGLVLALDDAERTIEDLEEERRSLLAGNVRLWDEIGRLDEARGDAQAELDRARAARQAAEAAERETAERLDESLRHAATLWQQGNELAEALSAAETRADAAVLVQSGAEARALAAEAQLAAAYGNAHRLWARGNALLDLVDTLTAELQRTRVETAELRLAQQQFFGEIRTRAEAHIDAVEEGLAFTGLDIDSLLLALDEAGGAGALGGPMVPALTGRPLNEAMWAEAADIVVLIDRTAALRDIANLLPIGLPLRDGYRLSSGFGTRTDPFTGRVARHHGLDFAAPHGTPIYATAPGTVVRAGWRGAYGYMVEVEHDFGLTTRYAHLSAVLVEEGADVEYGDRLGLMGSTGRSSGPHLHYEVRVTGDPRNPIRFIRAGQNVFQAAN